MPSKARVLRKVGKLWRDKLKPILLMILVLTSFRSAIADWNDVPTGSMKPSILEGDRIFVNKLAYGLKIPFTTWHLAHWNRPQRGEIVVFNSPKDGMKLVKRVVGVPGDVIVMVDNRLYINGQPVEYGPLPDATVNSLPTGDRVAHGFADEKLGTGVHAVMSTPGLQAMRTFGPITVPADEYFMMGDNRDNSADSRYIGTVKLDQILGRSSWVALSLDYAHYYLPRWGRFFKSIDG
jgi:signal peptidase I